MKNVKIHTHSLLLVPIPLVVEIVDGVMTMTMIHLAGASTRLLCFGPRRLNAFTMVTAGIHEVIERKTVPTILLVGIEMHLWDKKVHDIDDVLQVGKVILESLFEIDIVLACHIICIEDVSKEEFCSCQREVYNEKAESHGKSIVGVCKSATIQYMSKCRCCHSPFSLLEVHH